MQVNLSWAPVANALWYNIYRGTQTGGPYLIIAGSNPNPGQNPSSAQTQTTFQDGPGNLINGIDYFYVVTSVTQDGESAYSSEFHAAWPGAGSVPSGLTGVIT